MRNPQNELLRFFATPLDYWLGLIHFKRKRWNQADAAFEAAVRKNPAHSRSHFKRGLLAMKRKQWPVAHEFIMRAVFHEPTQPKWLVQLHQVEARLEGLEPPELLFSEKELRDQLVIHPDSVFLHSELAKVLRVERKWWQEIEALDDAVRLDGNDPELHYRLAQALEGLFRYGEARRHYELSIRPGVPDADRYYRLGLVWSLGDEEHPAKPEMARRFYEKAVAEQQDPALKALGIGVILQDDGRWHQAAEAYREMSAKDPQNAEIHFRIGMCHDRCYEWSKAEECYLRALAIDSTAAYWHYRLGFVRERQNKLADAAASYRIAAGSDDKRARSWSFRLACVLEALGARDEACAAYLASGVKPSGRKASEPQPDPTSPMSVPEIELKLAGDCTDAELWADLGRACEECQDWPKAAAAYRQAIDRSDSHNPDLYLGLGRCEMHTGNAAAACESMRGSRILKRAQGVSEAVFRTEPALRKVVTYTEFLESLPIRDKTILYESFHGKVMSCNPYALFLHLLDRPDFADWTHVWVMDDKSAIPGRFRSMPGVVFVSRDSEAYMKHLASVRVLVNNVTFPPYFIRKEGQIYLNTWHGTPWKMMGSDVRGEFMIYGNVARNFLQATHIISSNSYTTDILLGKYNIDGLYRGVAAVTGYPRIDLTLRASEEAKAALRKRLRIPDSSKVILYAPTWRGTHGNPAEESAEVMREVDALKTAGAHVLFRGHTLSGNRAEDINVPDDISTNELLAIVDVLVTDYSSIWFDFIATGRPVVFYLKDLEEYTRDRGLYFGVDELPGDVAYRLNDLGPMAAKALSGGRPHPKYADAVRKFCPAEDGDACGRVVDLIFKDGEPAARQSDRKSILIFGGGFLNNGITASLLNLLNAIDYSVVDVALAVEPGSISEDPERIRNLERVPAAVRILPRVGPSNTTLEERVIRQRVKRTAGLLDNVEMAECFKSVHAREFRRLFGDCRFSAAINVEGYNTFWSAVLSCAPHAAVGCKTIYQHSDKVAEWKTKFPQLDVMFHVYRFFDRIISVSEMTMENNIKGLCGRFNLPASKFDFVENMIDPEVIRARADEEPEAGDAKRIFGSGGPVFVTVGRLSIEKDHAKLIRAFALLRKSHPKARLLIVGDGPLLADLKNLVGELRLKAAVFFTGFRGNPFPYMRRSDCFVLSSNHEGQPMVLLEAIVLGLPIISTDIVGARSVIEGRSGHLVENSVEGLFSGMSAFIRGEIQARPVDMATYQKNALEAFYRKACGFKD